MHIFALKKGSYKTVYTVDRYIFEQATRLLSPYYQKNSKGEMSYYAICPQCENPIQLVGLIPKKNDKNRRVYAKHIGKNIPGLADYNHDAYLNCCFASRQRITKDIRKPTVDTISSYLLELLGERFDQVVYLLEKAIDIKISLFTAKALLENYIASNAHLYVGASVMNLPWMLGYFGNAQSLYKKSIIKGSELETALKEKGVNVTLNSHNCVERKDKKKFMDITACLMLHQFTPVENTKIETIKFVVTQNIDEKKITIFKKKIHIDHTLFQNLINAPSNKVFRRQNFIDMAKHVLALP